MKTRLALLVALALFVAGCGGSSEVADTQARERTPLTTTLATTTTLPATTTAAPATTSGLPLVSGQLGRVQAAMAQSSLEPPARIEGLIEVAGRDAELGQIEVALPFSSSFDTVTGDGHMLMDFSALSGLMAPGDEMEELAGLFDGFEVRQIGDTAYVKFGLFNMMLGVETPWLSMPVEDGQGFTQDFSTGVNPFDATGFLDVLSGSYGEVSVVGEETLRGVVTTRYRVIFDLESLAELDPEAYADLEDSAPVGFDELPTDIWVDDQHRVHRFLFEIEQPDVEGLNPGESFDYMRVQFDFSDYGGRVSVEPPPADQVTDVSDLEDWFMSGLEDAAA